MRKVAGVLFAAAMLLPVGLMAAPAGAAGGTTCKPPSGTVKISPGLGKTLKVQSIAINLPVSGCVGGGVKSGVFKGTIKTTPTDIAKFAAPGPPLKFTATITWNTGKTSTLAATSSTKVAKGVINSTVGGKISKGLFVGLTFKSSQTVKVGPTVGGLIKSISIKGTGSVTIR